jgi:low temperature requirement protein LtrA
VIGGPVLYLIGNLMFKRLSAPHFPLSHMVGLGLLLLLIPSATIVTPLGLAAATAAVLILVAVWEWLSFRPRRAPTAA